MDRRHFFFALGMFAAGAVTTLAVWAVTARSQSGVAYQLTHPPSGYYDLHPTFSPDGNRVVFGRQSALGGADLDVADVPSGATFVLVPQSSLPSNWSPNAGISWSPDGTRIAIMQDGGDHGIWIVDITGGPIPTQKTTWGKLKAAYR